MTAPKQSNISPNGIWKYITFSTCFFLFQAQPKTEIIYIIELI